MTLLLSVCVSAANAQPACAPAADSIPAIDGLHEYRSSSVHPLIGSVIDLRTPQYGAAHCPAQTLTQLAASLRQQFKAPRSASDGPRLLLLGEVHDNPTHHRLRAALLDAIFGGAGSSDDPPPTPALVFEHMRIDQQPAIDAALAGSAQIPIATKIERVFRAVKWDKSGWPDEKNFAPLLETALRLGMPIFAGDASRETIGRIAREGPAAIEPDERARLGLDADLAPDLQDALLQELEASHCGIMPKSRFGGMAFAQRFRDAKLASVLIRAAAKTGSAVLLAGNGHVRRDRGVPSALAAPGHRGVTVSVTLLEVEDGRTEAGAYLAQTSHAGGSHQDDAADVYVFTPRAPREDPCVAMRKQFGTTK